MSGRSWKTATAAGVAGVALLASGSALWALLGQGGPFMWGRAAGFAESHDRRAFRLLEGSKDPASLDAASIEIDRALELSPYSNAARLRLAYIDTARHGSLGPTGRALLSRSYDLTPYDVTVAAWRIRFSLEHWRELTPELRSAVHAEAVAFGRVSSADADVTTVLHTIHDPAGRLAAELWLRELSTRPRTLDSRSQRAGNRP